MRFILSILVLNSFLISDDQKAFSQDSIEHLLNLIPEDTGKVERLIAAAHNLENSKPLEAIELSREAFSISQKIHFQKGTVQSLSSMGRAFRMSGELDSALLYLRRSLEIANQINDLHSTSAILVNMGSVFRNKGIYDSAAIYYHRGLEIGEQTNDLEIKASCFNNLGNVLKDQKNYEQAISYYSQALGIRRKQKNQRGMANALMNLGVSYDLLKNYSQSETQFNEALKIFTSLGDVGGMAKCNNNIGQSYQAQGKYSEALSFLQQSLQLEKQLADKNGIASTEYSLGLLHEDMKNYDEANKVVTHALQIAIEIDNRQIQLDCYSLLERLSLAQGNYKDAHDFLSKKNEINDSLFNEGKARIIDDLQAKYETEKKEQQIKILNQENKTKDLQRNIFLVGSLALLIALIGGIFLFIQRQRISRQKILLKDRKISNLLQEQTISTYNAMIVGQEEERKRVAVDLHDRLGSMLSTVRAYFTAGQAEKNAASISVTELQQKTISLLDLSIEEVRKIANNLSTGMITDQGLRPAIEQLCETIEQGSHIHCEVMAYNLGNRMDNQTEIAIYRITQELLTNILKHARAKNITVQLNKIENNLQVTIEDDGVGYDFNEKRRSPGMGLKNILLRVEKLNGTFHVDSQTGKGSVSFLEIPLNGNAHPAELN